MQNLSDIIEMETKIHFDTTDSNGYLDLLNMTALPNGGKATFEWISEDIYRLIQVISRPILIIIGSIGNSLTFHITRKSSLKDVSSCFYMAVLALADSLVLWAGCFPGWMIFLTRHGIHIWTWTGCTLGPFLFRFGRHYSSIILVLMSLEKCFAVYFPLKSKSVCTVRTAKWATGIVGVVLAGYDAVYFFVMKPIISKSSNKEDCVLIDKYRLVLFSVDSVLYSFGPLALIFITNLAIVLKFIKAKCQNNSTESTQQALAKSATRGTAMVVTVSVTFLLLNSPEGIKNVLYKFALEKIPIYRVFMNITSYLNHAINGFLYIIVGSRFRMELFKIFSRKKRSDGLLSNASTNNTSLSSINERTI